MKFRMDPIFKNGSWSWQKYFNVDNFLSLNIALMQHSACWPIDWHILRSTNAATFVQTLHFLMAIISAAHLAFLWLYTFVIKIYNARTPIDDNQLIDISHCLIESIIYSFTLYTLIYYRLRHGTCAQLIKHMNDNFKRRSAIGKFYIQIIKVYSSQIPYRTNIRYNGTMLFNNS